MALAHLGSGASLAAVSGGKPVDTTMAFTPAAGIMMGTRPGDLDPGLIVHLLRTEKLSADQLDQWVNKQCGLLGVSGISNDLRDLMSRRATDPNAADAVNLFCQTAKKGIAAMAAAMGGIDTLIFAGGSGSTRPTRGRPSVMDWNSWDSRSIRTPTLPAGRSSRGPVGRWCGSS